MSQFEVTTFHPGHIEMSRLREHERLWLQSLASVDDQLWRFAANGYSWSLFKGNTHLSSGGVLPAMPHVGVLWQLPTVDVQRHQFQYSRIFLRMVDGLLKTGPFSRLQTMCVADHLHGRWMEFLGFHVEGIMKGYGANGEDYAMHARLRDGR